MIGIVGPPWIKRAVSANAATRESLALTRDGPARVLQVGEGTRCFSFVMPMKEGARLDPASEAEILSRRGVDACISLLPGGTINTETHPVGNFIIPHSYASFHSAGPVSTGCEIVDMSEPFCLDLSAKLKPALEDADPLWIDGAVMASHDFPYLPTAAEAQIFSALGCSAACHDLAHYSRVFASYRVCHASVVMMIYKCGEMIDVPSARAMNGEGARIAVRFAAVTAEMIRRLPHQAACTEHCRPPQKRVGQPRVVKGSGGP